jgi:hypothetical protein
MDTAEAAPAVRRNAGEAILPTVNEWSNASFGQAVDC